MWRKRTLVCLYSLVAERSNSDTSSCISTKALWLPESLWKRAWMLLQFSISFFFFFQIIPRTLKELSWFWSNGLQWHCVVCRYELKGSIFTLEPTIDSFNFRRHSQVLTYWCGLRIKTEAAHLRKPFSRQERVRCKSLNPPPFSFSFLSKRVD